MLPRHDGQSQVPLFTRADFRNPALDGEVKHCKSPSFLASWRNQTEADPASLDGFCQESAVHPDA
jgi:hypothetical protein